MMWEHLLTIFLMVIAWLLLGAVAAQMCHLYTKYVNPKASIAIPDREILCCAIGLGLVSFVFTFVYCFCGIVWRSIVWLGGFGHSPKN